jgi:hypothetical protein
VLPFCGLQIQDVEARVLGNTAAYSNPSSTFAPDP